MTWLAAERSRQRRADPRLILPECKSILVLGIAYNSSHSLAPSVAPAETRRGEPGSRGRVASYAWGEDYHLVLPQRLKALIAFIEEQAGGPVPHRWYTDTGPILERDLAQRAGLGWIGKNTCLINPRAGSYLLLAEILLDLELEPDPPFETDHCGTCTRCLDACPTQCILPDRTLDARRCISYLTIELKDDVPKDLRPLMQDWIFGCDICQQVCPWNRFAAPEGDASFHARSGSRHPDLIQILELTPTTFNRQFRDSPLRRAKRRGLVRNAVIALGNTGDSSALPALEKALDDPEAFVREHATWAIKQINKRAN
jgi:epoxyqueuosine reductase